MKTKRGKERVTQGALGLRGVRRIPAAQFKARCLSLMDEVERTGREVVVTKHGRPVARLAVIQPERPVPFVGRMRGTVEVRGDLIAPISPDWEIDGDL